MSKLDLDDGKAILFLTPEVAFYSSVLMLTRIKADEHISTAGTDGKDIMINPEFYHGLPNNRQQAFLLLHEIRHILDKHCLRKPRMPGADPKIVHRIWNIACDVRINNDLNKIKALEFIPCGVMMPEHDGLSAEEVFEILWEDPDMQAMAQNGSEPDQSDSGDQGSGGQGGSDPHNGKGKTFQSTKGKGKLTQIEDHLLDPQGDPDIIEVEISQRIVAAVHKCKEAGHSIPPQYKLYVDELLKPQVDYKKLVAKFVGSATQRQTNYAKPNRQMMPTAYIPSMTAPSIDEMVFIIDVSGSTVAFFKEFISEIASIFTSHPHTKIHVIQFDSAVRSIDSVRSLSELLRVEFNGGGGTRIIPPLEAAAKFKNAPCVFIITDGYFCESDYSAYRLRKPTCWVTWDNPNFAPPFGKVIHFQPSGKFK